MRFSVRNYKNVIPPQKTHQFPHIKRHHIRFRNCPRHADTNHALPGYSIATQTHSDRVFSGFDSAFGSSDRISTTFDTNSPHLDRVPFNSDRVSTISDAVSSHFNNVSTYSGSVSANFGRVPIISNTVSIHFNRVSVTFNIIAGSPMTHSLHVQGCGSTSLLSTFQERRQMRNIS